MSVGMVASVTVTTMMAEITVAATNTILTEEAKAPLREQTKFATGGAEAI